jgi:hypothetical protein
VTGTIASQSNYLSCITLYLRALYKSACKFRVCAHHHCGFAFQISAYNKPKNVSLGKGNTLTNTVVT